MNRVKRKQQLSKALPVIPDKLYFTISEVSSLCSVKAYVLRYWEQEFSQLKPVKRRGNRRFYQQHDVLLVRQIRKLLYDEGFTIEGARTKLSAPKEKIQDDDVSGATVKKVIVELESLLASLKIA